MGTGISCGRANLRGVDRTGLHGRGSDARAADFHIDHGLAVPARVARLFSIIWDDI